MTLNAGFCDRTPRGESSIKSHPGQRRLARAGDVGLELGAELLDSAHDRSGAGVAQHADRLAGHVLGEVEQELEVFLLALPGENPLEDPGGPRRAFPALSALRAGL